MGSFFNHEEEPAGVRTIFATGYIKTEQRSEMMSQGVVGIVQKPYLPDQLLAEIRAAMSKPVHFTGLNPAPIRWDFHPLFSQRQSLGCFNMSKSLSMLLLTD
jgi:DNA-binding response OmpR family regulator